MIYIFMESRDQHQSFYYLITMFFNLLWYFSFNPIKQVNRSSLYITDDANTAIFPEPTGHFDVSVLRLYFARCKPTNQRAAHLYIHEHTIKGENLGASSFQGYFTGCIRGHRTATWPFSAQPMLHTLFRDCKEQCEIPKKPSQ